MTGQKPKALNLQKPWGWAIVYGGKDVENRSWSTDYRGDLLAHQGKAQDRDGLHSAPGGMGRSG